MNDTVAERFAAFSTQLEVEQIPTEVCEAAKLHILDTLGTGLAAHGLGIADYARAAVTEPGVQGPATAIGVDGGLPAADAALANGTICHALDYDDTHTGAISHVSVAVVPAALAVAQEQGVTGAELLAAIVAGNEIVIRLGVLAGAGFHARGFHPTAVCGIFGATAAAARLRGLDAGATTNALGIAGSMASGILEFLSDGSATKRLHPGWAAHSAILACRLAAHGATGPATVFEGRYGVYAAYLGRDDIDFEPQLQTLGEHWETPRIAFKPYPACHYVHASVDATRTLLDEAPIAIDEITEIIALTTEAGVPLVLEPLDSKRAPRSEYEAKFSLPYSVASMLVRGGVDVSTYTDGAIREERVAKLAKRVRYEVKDYETFPKAFPGGVRIVMNDGSIREAELAYQRGGPENPMTTEDVLIKFQTNAALAVTDGAIGSLQETTLGLEDEVTLNGFGELSGASAQEVAA
ncbi:MAG: MmgE/PrpD family protein [Thermoleophilia bacterium]|nr:MmgE/PrpD family protein [Thermoleophilia bacterium]